MQGKKSICDRDYVFFILDKNKKGQNFPINAWFCYEELGFSYYLHFVNTIQQKLELEKDYTIQSIAGKEEGRYHLSIDGLEKVFSWSNEKNSHSWNKEIFDKVAKEFYNFVQEWEYSQMEEWEYSQMGISSDDEFLTLPLSSEVETEVETNSFFKLNDVSETQLKAIELLYMMARNEGSIMEQQKIYNLLKQMLGVQF